MESYYITYAQLGSGSKPVENFVVIYSTDKLKNGKEVLDIYGAIKRFEELAKEWETYENRHAILSIQMTYLN